MESRGKELVKYINSIIGNNLRAEIDAEEILSDTVRYVLEHPEILRDRTSESIFLFLIWKSKMLVIDRARELRQVTESAKRARPEIANQAVENAVEPSPSFQIHRADKRLSLRRCIDLLPSEDQKQALSLVRLQGLSLKEAGAVMDRSPEAVKKLVKRAFTNLTLTLRSLGTWKYATTGETT